MSLHVLANHMATKGRGEDSMLVHMTPHEVASLQALALKHGGSLTINPDTGLPEASFLKKLLPMIAGFALGPAGFGLMSAASAGLTVGAVTGLATGSLSKGLMAGLGAYGGAGLGDAFMGAGANSIGSQALSTAGYTPEIAAGTPLSEASSFSQGAVNQASMADKLGAGFKAVTSSPETAMKFAGDNWKYGLAAAAPLLADAMVPTTVKAPPSTPTGYIRPFQFDENTRTVKAMDPVLASEWGTRSFPDYIRKTPQPPGGMNRGGIVALADGGPADPYAKYNTMSGQSKAAYDYLMGNAEHAYGPAITTQGRPVVSNTNVQPVVQPVTSTTPNEVQTVTTGPTGSTGPIEPPVQPPIIDPFEEDNFNFPIDVDPYDQNNQDAIDKYEEEVGNEQYDQNNQDAIDKYEEEAANEQYDQNNQDAINKIEQEVTDEDETDERHGFINPNLPPEEEETTVNPTPEELINRDEFGNLDEAIADRAYDQNNEDAINKYEQEIRNENLIREDPYGDLDAAIAENNARDFREASDIDDATIGIDPATNNGAAEAAAREQEEAQRDEDRIINDYFGYGDYGGIAAGGGDYGGDENYGDIAAGGGDYGGGGGNNTYVGPVENVQQQGLPDEFGSYAADVGGGEYTGGGDGGGYGGYDAYGGFEDYMNGYDPGYYGGGEGYSWNGEANGGLIGYARGGYAHPFFSKQTGKFNYKPPQVYANGGYAMGGLGSLGGYSDGGRLLKGPGDGVSDSIPATIGNKKQPARLADGEFVVPARIVSELGNGSTEAGARKLYAMMDRIQKARGNTVGKGKVAANTRSDKHLPA